MSSEGEFTFRFAAAGEVLDAVEVVMGVFSEGGKIDLRKAATPKALTAARVMGAGDASAARAGVLLVGALIRALAMETGRDERDILRSIREENGF